MNGQVLASADGETWFSSRGGSLDPSQATKQNKYAKYVGFRGRGEVGRVTGVQTAARAARATVAFKHPRGICVVKIYGEGAGKAEHNTSERVTASSTLHEAQTRITQSGMPYMRYIECVAGLAADHKIPVTGKPR